MLKNILHAALLLGCGISFAAQAQDTTATRSDDLSVEQVLRGETKLTRDQWLRRQLFVENILTQSAVNLSDSTLLFRVQSQSPLSLNKSQLNAIAPRVDRIDEKFRRDQLGLPPMFNVGTLIGKGVKYLAEKLGAGPSSNPLAVIPSELEIEVMSVLWEKNAATSREIYVDLDSAKLTAVDLQQALANMADRGLVDRQQISPRHELTILGVFAIEESSLNRKNREYLYRPKVTRQTMLSFLDATAFSHRLVAANNHSLIDAHLRKLMARLVTTEN
jgi:predicted transcriptional regulator